ncbi:MAG: NAD-dependent epimerase/dehydratase family protein [Actinomycetota bacterium]|nr:NAD-dependent epimerase/dehydratase family protein [Actinomycetota bacterium]
MKAFLTGGTGFIGGYVVRKLRERGDDVVALVRSPRKAAEIEKLGCEVVQGDLSDEEVMREAMAGCDAVFHIAAVYKVGVPSSECPPMHEANVGGTQRAIDAAATAGVPKIVYVSTIGYFGNTRGEVVDESFQRRPGDWLSCYDETKYKAHEVAKQRIAQGAPIVIVQPGAVYGPGDESEVGTFVLQMATGKLKFLTFPEVGFTFCFVEDVAEGIIAAHDKGAVGESYVLGGEIGTLGDLVSRAARLTGRKPPRITIPGHLVKACIPMAPLVTKAMGLPPNLRELIRSSDGVTYWASDSKARSELDYSSRPLDEGLRQTLVSLGTS